MVTNRIRDHFSPSTTRVAVEMMEAAFVACPVCALMSASQFEHVREIYRLAAEMTQAHLQPRKITALPKFSRN